VIASGASSIKFESETNFLADSLVNFALRAVEPEAEQTAESAEGNDSISQCEEAASMPSYKSDWLLLHEGLLLALMQDTEHIFTPLELCRIRKIVASIPSRCHKNLEEIKDCIIYNPMLHNVAMAFVMPSMRTRRTDGSVGNNRVGTSSRHGRLAQAICNALDIVLNSMTAEAETTTAGREADHDTEKTDVAK